MKTWDIFLSLVNNAELTVHISSGNYQGIWMYPRSYAIHRRDIRIKDGVITFYNGSMEDYEFLQEFNETVHSDGEAVYPYIRTFDTEETGEYEDDWEGYSHPITRELPTYKLIKVKVEFYKRIDL
jgi:hypothetical protein